MYTRGIRGVNITNLTVGNSDFVCIMPNRAIDRLVSQSEDGFNPKNILYSALNLENA